MSNPYERCSRQIVTKRGGMGGFRFSRWESSCDKIDSDNRKRPMQFGLSAATNWE